MKKFVDYYQFLGIEMNSTDADILKACRKIVRENNIEGMTDRTSIDYQKRRSMLIITDQIYRVLKDHDRRAEYDKVLINYRAEQARKAKYFNAYSDNEGQNESIPQTPDYSEPWRRVIQKDTALDANPDKPITAQQKSELTSAEDYSADWQKMIRNKNALSTNNEQENLQAVEVSDMKKAISEPTTPDESIISRKPQQKTAQNKANDLTSLNASKPLDAVQSNDTSSSKMQERTVRKNNTAVRKKAEKPQIVVSQKETSSTKADKQGRASSKEVPENKTKPSSKISQKSNKSSGVLLISRSFAREILKLEVQKNDTPQKYIIRNKKVFGTILALTVVSGAMGIRHANKNLEKEEISFQSTISSTEEATIEPRTDDVINPTSETEAVEQTITIYRVHKAVPGDTLSQFSANAGVSMEEIKRINAMKDDNVLLGKSYIIPYIIEAEDLHIYTSLAPYDANTSLEAYAREYETDPDTLWKINPDEITLEVNSGYQVFSDTLLVPNFVTKNEYREIKAVERVTQRIKSK